ncbi:hypothetical protein RDI58_028589 [Solanum bulbocastanum]|uniref:Uncharacterized protein n=1 Tax=Solanum bulbocastanum TaxID=147425 RepID=A0AAN8XZ63_SOLBU
MDPSQTNSIFPSIPFILVIGLYVGTIPFYMTSFRALNTNPSSWVVMRLQERSLTLNIIIENQEIVLVIRTPSLLAQIVSEGIGIVVETYNSHLWMLTSLLPPENYQIPMLPFFHIPTWGTPMFNPLYQHNSMAVPVFSPGFPIIQGIDPLYHHWQVNGLAQRTEVLFSIVRQSGPMESTGAQMQNSETSASQGSAGEPRNQT